MNKNLLLWGKGTDLQILACYPGTKIESHGRFELSAAEMRKKEGDEAINQDVPPKERLSDEELLKTGLASIHAENKDAHGSSYCEAQSLRDLNGY